MRRRVDARGAVYVEFLIAFIPVFLMFLSLWQLGIMLMARLVVEHAAVAGARAAAVVIAEGDRPGELTPENERDIRDAVYLALAPLIVNRYVGTIQVRYPSMPGGLDKKTLYEPRPKPSFVTPPGHFKVTAEEDGDIPLDLVRVRVDATFLCRTSPVNRFMCRGLNPSRVLVAEAAFPYQGARYFSGRETKP